ncbi:MAG TPA: DUF2283 domain-containing protein [Tepidisphaeraceae bacterium]|nr:DUF2283 domain-containing protein [Tepidisphaeraceae bacterium]
MASGERIFRPKGDATEMKNKQIKFEYDAEVDAAYLTLKRAPVAESEEVRPGIILDFGESDEIVGIEILRFTKRFRARDTAITPGRAVARSPAKRRAAG